MLTLDIRLADRFPEQLAAFFIVALQRRQAAA
jgi:hypothetical protein